MARGGVGGGRLRGSCCHFIADRCAAYDVCATYDVCAAID
jgi:hypothetical protein